METEEKINQMKNLSNSNEEVFFSDANRSIKKKTEKREDIISEEKIEKNEILDQETMEKIKDYANKYFSKILNENIEAEGKDTFEAQDVLNRIVDKEKQWREAGIVTLEFKKATKIFLDELLLFSEANKKDENFNKFSYYLNNTIFNGTPNIISPLNIEDSFDFTTKATRIKELQGTIGGKAIDNLIEKTESLFLYGSEEEKDLLYKIYKNNTIAERLDELQVLESVAGHAMAEGGRLYSSEKGVIGLLKKIKEDKDNSFFENCYIDLVLDRIGQEKEKKELPSFVIPGNPSQSRLAEPLPENYKVDFEKLSKAIYPDTSLKKGERIVPIGQNIVAIIDQSKTPIKFSVVELSEERKPETGVNGVILRKIKDALDKNKEDIVFDNFINFTNEGIFKPFYKINEGDFSALGDKWSGFSGGKISKEKWTDYFRLNNEIVVLRQERINRESVKHEEAGDQNEKDSKIFQDNFAIEAKKILALDGFGENKLVCFYDAFEKATEEEDNERAFYTMDKFITMLESKVYGIGAIFKDLKNKDSAEQKNIPKVVLDLISGYDKLKASHLQKWKECEIENDNFYREQTEKHLEDILYYKELTNEVLSEEKAILDNLQKEITEIEKKVDGDLIKAEFLDYGEMVDKYENIFFRQKDSKEIGLLFQHLHRPKIKKMIEEKLGVDFKEISFRYQVYLLDFLSHKSEKEVEEVREFLNGAENEEAKNNRIKSFLSLESGEKMGENILKIGKKLDAESADAVFAKYAEIISLADKTREDLEDLFKNRKDVSKGEREKIIQNLLKKGNQLLVEYGDRASSEKDNLGNKSILEELEKTKTDLIFMASILKALKKEGKREDIEIDNFKGVTFEKRTVDDLTNGGKIMDTIDSICKESGKRDISNLSAAEIKKFLENKDLNIDRKDQEKTKIVIVMIQMYYDNYKNAPEMQKVLVQNFEKLLKEGKDSIDIYALLKDGLPYAFCRFDDLGNEKKYAASLNVDPKIQDSAIGKAFFEKCMEDNKKYTITGECSLLKPLVCSHIEKSGFVAREVFDFSGELSVKIEKPGENKKTYHYKGLDKKEIIAENEKKFSGNKYDKNGPMLVLKFEAGSKELYVAIEDLLNNGHYAMTRYFVSDNKNEKSKREVYCAFERGES